MSDLISAAKQALEALEEFCQHANDQHQMNALSEDSWLWMMWKDGLKAITSLRQAIAEAEKHEVSQEPVAVTQLHTDGWDLVEGIDTDWLETLPFGTTLYTHPQPKPEPVSDEERKYNIRLNSLIKQIKQETVALDVTLDEAAVEMLNAFSSPLPPSLDEYNELRLMLGEGHSGYGLYLSLADYPEEGSELLVNTHPQPKREPLTMFETEKLAKRFGVEWTNGVHALCNEAAHGITSDMKQEYVDKTAKQRHEWVGLTDEEILDLYSQFDWDIVTGWEYERAIEAKLKEKNT